MNEEIIKRNQLKIRLIVLLIVGILIVAGLSYALIHELFIGNENKIKSGVINFSYNEGLEALNINDPEFVNDDTAKISDNYYSFDVNANATGKTTIGYYIYFSTDNTNTLTTSQIKMYLTGVDNNNDLVEDEVIKVNPTIGNLFIPFDKVSLTYDNTKTDYILYSNQFSFTENNSNTLQTHRYRFRMWFNSPIGTITGTNANDSIHQYSKTEGIFKIKINIRGVDGVPSVITVS